MFCLTFIIKLIHRECHIFNFHISFCEAVQFTLHSPIRVRRTKRWADDLLRQHLTVHDKVTAEYISCMNIYAHIFYYYYNYKFHCFTCWPSSLQHHWSYNNIHCSIYWGSSRWSNFMLTTSVLFFSFFITRLDQEHSGVYW